MLRISLLVAALTVPLLTESVWSQEPVERLKVSLKARPFNLKQVKLLDGPFRDAMERDRKYLHSLDADRLLHTWRINAGLPTDAEPLGGWERPNCELRGHTLGHYLSACALMYASTGDEKLKAKADAILAELAKCQKALGDSGYLSAFPESLIDRVENCQRVWAPFYTLHKVFAGLQDMYSHCGNEQALEIVEKMAGWLKGRLGKIDEAQMDRILNHTEQGGMNETLANLYSVTGNRDYLAMARRFDQKRYVEPLARGEDKLKGEHVNSFIPNMIGTARQYEMSGNERDRKIAEYFWNEVTSARTYCTGGTSNEEHWRSDPYQLADQLGDHTQETCCTYNMLKLTRHLFCWKPNPKYADYYERALWTSILGTQNPETGMMMYFVTLATGRWKMFNLPTESFWCCTGTGIENHAKYGDSIYFHSGDSLFVNQFIASEAEWKEKGVKVRQETTFPERESTALIVRTDKPVKFSMRVRVPYWASKGVTVKLNGEPLKRNVKPCSYLAVNRTWKDGDKLEVAMPMSLHPDAMPDDKTLVSLMYGPFVLAGKLGGKGLTTENTHTSQNWYKFEGVATAPPLLGDINNLNAWIKPVKGELLTFRTTGQEKNFTLIPYYRLFGERYVVYWNVYKKGSPEHRRMLERLAAEQRRAAHRLDKVEIGDAKSEKDHALKGSSTASGQHAGRQWRHAQDGGWFSYRLKVRPDGQNTLVCTYWGSDSGARMFDVLVEGEKVATQTLNGNRPEKFFEVEYKLPIGLTQGKENILSGFKATRATTRAESSGARC